MLKNYKLIKSYELEALQQKCKDLHDALTEATNLLDRAGKIAEEQRQLINRQQKQIRELIGIDLDLDFPNTTKGGYPNTTKGGYPDQ